MNDELEIFMPQGWWNSHPSGGLGRFVPMCEELAEAIAHWTHFGGMRHSYDMKCFVGDDGLRTQYVLRVELPPCIWFPALTQPEEEV